jgi:Uma2 family endonuclease
MGGSVKLNERNVPQPGLFLWRDSGEQEFAVGSAVALAVEVSASTLKKDLGWKRRLYARTGVPEYWVVDLKAKLVHQFCEPTREGYAKAAQTEFGRPIGSLALGWLTIAGDLFG